MTTIYEIAKKASVSHMTVSRVFNDPDLVDKETREKIMSIVNELDYSHSEIARSMRTKKTNYIGIILPDISNTFFAEVVKGVEDCARKNKHNVILANTDNDSEVLASSIRMFINRGLDGIILGGIGESEEDLLLLKKVKKKSLPVVFIDRYIPGISCSRVITDNYKAAYVATRYLVRLGHKRIAVITSSQKIKIFQDRLKGFKEALKDNGLECCPEDISEGYENIEGGYDCTKKLEVKNTGITAIFSTCDLMAFGAYGYCRENNIKIPDDVSIISFDNITPSAILIPPLTTMNQKKYDMGFHAAKILIDAINRGVIPKTKIVLESDLIERDSCKNIALSSRELSIKLPIRCK